MKILNVEQIRALDAHTIEHEPIASIDLMERAAATFVQWWLETFGSWDKPVFIFCGPGNNGGDGLAIARMLFDKSYDVRVFIFRISDRFSADFKINLDRLADLKGLPVEYLSKGEGLPPIEPGSMVVDAVFGSGLNRPIPDFPGDQIRQINQLDVVRVAVDVPSGLFADRHSEGVVFQAHYTFSFELPKLAFLFPENQNYVGKWVVRSIGLDAGFIHSTPTNRYFVDYQSVSPLLRDRRKFDHKGSFGHALLVAGGYGKVGAAILAARACLRSGAGLATIHAPKCGYVILQVAFPEAMVRVDEHEYCVSNIPVSGRYAAIGAGCGLGTNKLTARALFDLIKNARQPLVLDADALNILSQHPHYLHQLPENTILTPHPKEFERLFGKTKNDFERHHLQINKARELGVFIILKGANTCIACPDGTAFFNSTGNPGMATGGSGDVLTGLLTGLLAQGYPARDAAILGVFLHGLAGDLAAEKTQQEALLASDLIAALGAAFRALRQTKNL